jgi:uncharacterized protein with HEPN domain
MPERKISAYVKDTLNSIERIEQYSADFSFEEFTTNFMAIEACLYNIQIIGKAVSKIPNGLKSNTPHIPWVLIKGMRNRLIHEYFGTDYLLVWNVINNELPALKTELVKVYSSVIEENK